jgi:hypothetical protein
MTEKNKFVFESFQDFVENILEKVSTGQINEEEAANMFVAEANLVIGDLGIKGEMKTACNDFFAQFSKQTSGADKDSVFIKDKSKELLKSVFEALNDVEAGREIVKTKSGWKRDYVEGAYEYAFAGAAYFDDLTYFDPLEANDKTFDSDTKYRPLNRVLGAINLYNIKEFENRLVNVNGDLSDVPMKTLRKSGLNLDLATIKDLSGKTIETVVGNVPQEIAGKDETEFQYILKIPLYSVAIFNAGKGEPLDETATTEVIKPAGTSIKITDKLHASTGMDFFEENAVKISAAGMGAIKAMLSEYNTIDKIVVNGGASSKPTSRAGGNEQLAKDRRAAGMKALEDLKKNVPQLKNAQIVEGTAKVQSEAEESDPKMQQVSFMVSGSSKASEIVNSEAVTITTIDKKMGDQVRLWKNEMIVAIKGYSPEK